MGEMKGEVKVLGTWSSPYAMRPRIGLNIKCVEYEFIVSKMRPQKGELLLKSNPVHKKIPVFFHNDKPICESLVILEYIDEVWPSGPSILPSHPYDRAIQRFWAAYIDDKWWPSLKGITMAQGEEAQAAALEKAKEGLALLEDAFLQCSKGKPFFNGDEIGYLDIALGCFLPWLKATENMKNLKLIDEANIPALAAWAHRLCADDAVKGLIPETGKLAEFINMLKSYYNPPTATN